MPQRLSYFDAMQAAIDTSRRIDDNAFADQLQAALNLSHRINLNAITATRIAAEVGISQHAVLMDQVSAYMRAAAQGLSAPPFSPDLNAPTFD